MAWLYCHICRGRSLRWQGEEGGIDRIFPEVRTVFQIHLDTSPKSYSREWFYQILLFFTSIYSKIIHLFWSLRSMFFRGRNGFRQWQNRGKKPHCFVSLPPHKPDWKLYAIMLPLIFRLAYVSGRSRCPPHLNKFLLPRPNKTASYSIILESAVFNFPPSIFVSVRQGFQRQRCYLFSRLSFWSFGMKPKRRKARRR